MNTYQTCSPPYGIATSVNSNMTKYAVTENFAIRCEDITTKIKQKFNMISSFSIKEIIHCNANLAYRKT